MKSSIDTQIKVLRRTIVDLAKEQARTENLTIKTALQEQAEVLEDAAKTLEHVKALSKLIEWIQE